MASRFALPGTKIKNDRHEAAARARRAAQIKSANGKHW